MQISFLNLACGMKNPFDLSIWHEEYCSDGNDHEQYYYLMLFEH
jgi:hypothetical protein